MIKYLFGNRFTCLTRKIMCLFPQTFQKCIWYFCINLLSPVRQVGLGVTCPSIPFRGHGYRPHELLRLTLNSAKEPVQLVLSERNIFISIWMWWAFKIPHFKIQNPPGWKSPTFVAKSPIFSVMGNIDKNRG